MKKIKVIQIWKTSSLLWGFPSRVLELLYNVFRSFHFSHYALSLKGFSAISLDFLQLVQNLVARMPGRGRTFEHWCTLTTNMAVRRKKKVQNTTFLHFSRTNNSQICSGPGHKKHHQKSGSVGFVGCLFFFFHWSIICIQLKETFPF